MTGFCANQHREVQPLATWRVMAKRGTDTVWHVETYELCDFCTRVGMWGQVIRIEKIGAPRPRTGAGVTAAQGTGSRAEVVTLHGR